MDCGSPVRHNVHARFAFLVVWAPGVVGGAGLLAVLNVVVVAAAVDNVVLVGAEVVGMGSCAAVQVRRIWEEWTTFFVAEEPANSFVVEELDFWVVEEPDFLLVEKPDFLIVEEPNVLVAEVLARVTDFLVVEVTKFLFVEAKDF